MPNQCPLCQHRVSDWMMSAGKSVCKDGEIFHKACLIDFELRYGHPHPAAIGAVGAITHAIGDNYR